VSPAALDVLEHLEAEGVAQVQIPRHLTPGELAAALIAAGSVATEVGDARPDDLYVAVVRGSRINKPTAEWVWISPTAWPCNLAQPSICSRCTTGEMNRSPARPATCETRM